MNKYKLHIFTIIALMLTFLIYHFENEVNMLDREIMTKLEKIEKYSNDITVLEAEWSYQNSPKRLAKLNHKISESQKMLKPTYQHFTDISNIESKKIYFSQKFE